MSINRAPYNALADDDGSNTVGSIWNKQAIKNVLLDPIDAALVQVGRVVQRIALVGLQHDLGLIQPGIDTLLLCTNASLLTLDGIADGVDGQQVTIVATNARVDLLQYTGSVAGNRFANIATSAPTSLATSGKAVYQYDAVAGVWRLISHEQGAWILVPFSAANFSADVGTWTVEAGDVSTFAYQLRGCTLMIALYLTATSLSAAAGVLNVKLPGGFVSAFSQSCTVSGFDGVPVAVTAILTGGQIQMYRYGVQWGVTTNGTGVNGELNFAVT